jgi:hypothetical protein
LARSLFAAYFVFRGTDRPLSFKDHENVIESHSPSSTIQDGEGMAREARGMRDASEAVFHREEGMPSALLFVKPDRGGTRQSLR